MDISAIGPRQGNSGTWCCGLNCGAPCPYGLKIEPTGATRERPRRYNGTEWCKTCGWFEDCRCGFYDIKEVNAYRRQFDLIELIPWG